MSQSDPTNCLRRFLRSATPTQREELAVAVGTSVGYLYQLAGGKRGASGVLVFQIEDAGQEMRGRYPELPALSAREIAYIKHTSGLLPAA